MNKLKFIPLLCGLLFVENFHTDNNCIMQENINSKYTEKASNTYTLCVGYHNGFPPIAVVTVDDDTISSVEYYFKAMMTSDADGNAIDVINSENGKNVMQQLKSSKGKEVGISIKSVDFIFSNKDQFKNFFNEFSNCVNNSPEYKKKYSHWWNSWFRK